MYMYILFEVKNNKKKTIYINKERERERDAKNHHKPKIADTCSSVNSSLKNSQWMYGFCTYNIMHNNTTCKEDYDRII